MDGRLTQANCDEAGDYVVPNVLSPRDLVSRPDNMDETVLSSYSLSQQPISLESFTVMDQSKAANLGRQPFCTVSTMSTAQVGLVVLSL